MDTINRTFVGVRVPAAQFAQIEEKLILIKRKPGVDNIRWNAPSELILTLASLGELGIGTMASLRPVMQQIAEQYSPLDLEIRGFAGLPNMIQPRYLYAGFDGPDVPRLLELAQKVDQAMRPLTPYPDSKPFHPHILLGRLKTENETFRVNLGRALKLVEQPSMGQWRIDHIELLISAASTSGIGYSVIESAALRG